MKLTKLLILLFIPFFLSSRLLFGDGWTTPPLEVSVPSNVSAANQAALAVDLNNNATCIWVQPDGVNARIFASILPSGMSTWSTPVAISSVGFNATTPAIAVDPSGNVVAVWIISPNSVESATLSAPIISSSWSSPINVSAGALPAIGSDIAVNGEGDAVAVWLGGTGSTTTVNSARLPHGTGMWTPVQALGTVFLPNSDTIPHVSTNASGFTTAIWVTLSGAHDVVQAKTTTLTNSIILPIWTTTTLISSLTEDAELAFVAVDPSGNAIATWDINTGTNFIVQTSTLPSGMTTWSSPIQISNASSTNDSSNGPIKIDSFGNAIAIWIQNNGSHFIATSAILPFGGSWSTPYSMSPTGFNAFHPQLALNAAGDAVAAWRSSGMSTKTIQAALRPFGSPIVSGQAIWFSTQNISTTGATAGDTAVGIDSSGTATAVWNEGPPDEIKSASSLAPPTVTNVNPNSGPAAGGSPIVTITGSGFTSSNANTIVQFGGVNALSFNVVSPTTITATPPAGTAGTTVDVTVATPDGLSPISSADQYTYAFPIVVLPPTNVQGSQTFSHFFSQTDLINVLSWQAPAEGNTPVAYKIYRDSGLTQLVATVPANDPLTYQDHNRHAGVTYTYYIVSVDGSGNVSAAAGVTVKG